MERTAACLCGQLKVTVEGDPGRVNICNCTDCQRRTGSAFQLGAFFDKTQRKSIEGDSNIFTRKADSGREIELHFCPNCGVTVYFEPQARPTVFGVPGGCFADPGFPTPNFAVWTQSKHHWVELPELEGSFEQQSP